MPYSLAEWYGYDLQPETERPETRSGAGTVPTPAGEPICVCHPVTVSLPGSFVATDDWRPHEPTFAGAPAVEARRALTEARPARNPGTTPTGGHADSRSNDDPAKPLINWYGPGDPILDPKTGDEIGREACRRHHVWNVFRDPAGKEFADYFDEILPEHMRDLAVPVDPAAHASAHGGPEGINEDWRNRINAAKESNDYKEYVSTKKKIESSGKSPRYQDVHKLNRHKDALIERAVKDAQEVQEKAIGRIPGFKPNWDLVHKYGTTSFESSNKKVVEQLGDTFRHLGLKPKRGTIFAKMIGRSVLLGLPIASQLLMAKDAYAYQNEPATKLAEDLDIPIGAANQIVSALKSDPVNGLARIIGTVSLKYSRSGEAVDEASLPLTSQKTGGVVSNANLRPVHSGQAPTKENIITLWYPDENDPKTQCKEELVILEIRQLPNEPPAAQAFDIYYEDSHGRQGVLSEVAALNIDPGHDK